MFRLWYGGRKMKAVRKTIVAIPTFDLPIL
jgi:hypothetical protein